MTARELLRLTANYLDEGHGSFGRDRAASLRALADRWDAEEAEINRIRPFAAGTCLALLARLDAPVTPGEPPGCLKPMTDEQRAAFVPISDEAIAEALRKGAEDRDRAMNPWKACEPWCGMPDTGGRGRPGALYTWDGPDRDSATDFCTLACQRAGRALNPRAAK